LLYFPYLSLNWSKNGYKPANTNAATIKTRPAWIIKQFIFNTVFVEISTINPLLTLKSKRKKTGLSTDFIPVIVFPRHFEAREIS
jgi:hypothetical protein